MIVLSRSKDAAEFVRMLTTVRAYASLDISLMDPLCSLNAPRSGSVRVPPPSPSRRARKHARTDAQEKRRREQEGKREGRGSCAPGLVVTQGRLGDVGARRRLR